MRMKFIWVPAQDSAAGEAERAGEWRMTKGE